MSAAPPFAAKWSGARNSSNASRAVTGSLALPTSRPSRLAMQEISPNVSARSSQASNRSRGRRVHGHLVGGDQRAPVLRVVADGFDHLAVDLRR